MAKKAKSKAKKKKGGKKVKQVAKKPAGAVFPCERNAAAGCKAFVDTKKKATSRAYHAAFLQGLRGHEEKAECNKLAQKAYAAAVVLWDKAAAQKAYAAAG